MAKRSSYTAAFKLKIVETAEKVGNRSAGREHLVTEKLHVVCDWRKKKADLSVLLKRSRLQQVGVKPRWPELETKVMEWVLDKRLNGIGLSGTMIRLKSKLMAKDMPPEQVEGFTGCTSWLYHFMKRKGLVIRQKTKIAQRLPHEFEEKIMSFQRMMIRMRQENKYEMQHIENMDETPMNFDMPPSHTVNPVSEKTVLIKTTGNEKTHFTVVLSCLANGTKLKPMIIFKRKTMPKEDVPSGVFVHVHQKGWMDEQGMLLWIEKVWERRPGHLLRKKACLVYDMFKTYLMDSIKNKLKRGNADVAIIPGVLTSQLQPLDVSINKPFKEKVRMLWSDWMAGSADHALARGGRLKKPSITLLCQWVVKTWNEIDSAIIIKPFKKCCISNALDGSEDSILYDDDSNGHTGPFADVDQSGDEDAGEDIAHDDI